MPHKYLKLLKVGTVSRSNQLSYAPTRTYDFITVPVGTRPFLFARTCDTTFHSLLFRPTLARARTRSVRLQESNVV